MKISEIILRSVDHVLCEHNSQEVAHKNPSIDMMKYVAKHCKYHSARFVIYNDGTVVIGDSENFTHHSMAPAQMAWNTKGYIQYLGDNDYAYRSMEPFSALNKYHPILKTWEKHGIENGNPDQSHLNKPMTENQNDWEIRNYHKLDAILVKLCELVIKQRKQNPEKYGMVAAAILDLDNRIVAGVSKKIGNKWCHAERYAMDRYQKIHGDIPDGSICITTCSPCSEHMSDRYKESCTDLINSSNIHKVYTGYLDPTQSEHQRKFNIIETSNSGIRDFCQKLAETFEDSEEEQQSTDDILESYGRYWCSTDNKWKTRKSQKKTRKVGETVKSRIDPKCWKGYHKSGTKIKGGVKVNNCVKTKSIEEETYHGNQFYESYRWLTWPEDDALFEAEYQGHKITLNKPQPGDVKKFKVYVKKGDRVVKVNFGDPDMRIRRSNPQARKSFRARHRCDTAHDKTTARYWSCRNW